MADETPRPKRTQEWLRLYSILPRNPKIARLTDGQFRAYVYALCAAREEPVRGEWLGRAYLEAALGRRYARHIDALLSGGLLEEEPDGSIRIPQWHLWNPSDPTNAERQRRWYARDKARRAYLTEPNALGNAISEAKLIEGNQSGEACAACEVPFSPGETPTIERSADGPRSYHATCLE